MIPVLIFLFAGGGLLAYRIHRENLVPPAIREQVVIAVNDCIDRFNQAHGTNYPYPSIGFNDNASDEYAEADYRTWSIQFNSDYVLKDLNDTLNDTVPHEVAHLIVDKNYPPTLQMVIHDNGGIPQQIPTLVSPVAPHGIEWQTVMRELGGDPCKHGYCHA